MSPDPAFTITYWGITGTISAPLRPSEVTDKLVRAITHLLDRGLLQGLGPGPDLEGLVRGAVETELPFHLRSSYGGNTTCVEVRTADALLILDCGSGFRELGAALEQRWRSAAGGDRSAHVLVTHPHMDHTLSMPFFAPYYDRANWFTIWASQAVLDSLRAVLDPRSALSRTYFPPTYDQMSALHSFRRIEAGSDFFLGSTRVRAYALNHPGGCLAYRLDNGGRSFVFATDHEHAEVPDRGLADFARGADLLYTEGQYTRAEYQGQESVSGDGPMSRRGWGHSPVEACVATAVAAGVAELHIGHRDPRRGDEDIARLDAYVRQELGAELARAGRPADSCRALIPHEGLTVRL